VVHVNTGAGVFLTLIYVAVIVVVIAGIWKTFEKAGEPGWAAIIPFYNYWVMVKVGRKEWIWFLFLLIPCLNIIAWIVICLAIAEQFGKSAGFGVGLIFLPFIFFLILGFGDAQYQGQISGPPPGQAPPPSAPAV
jgi:hypothetical protein